MYCSHSSRKAGNVSISSWCTSSWSAGFEVANGALDDAWLSGSLACSRNENTQPMSVIPSSTDVSVAFDL